MTQPQCDLILLSWNHQEETQPCLDSLFQATDVPARLLIVDNGSEPPVRRFLAAVKPRGMITEVRLLQNERNEGFSRGMNRGIRASTAPYVCLLNNDVRVTRGWLRQMLAVADAHPTIGVVNPDHTTADGEQATLEVRADRLAAQRGRYTELGMCNGFCMLVKRDVLDRIGLLSEEVERIFFEDEDFCMRAKVAGYQCVFAHAAFVRHTEHRTVGRMREREALFERNRHWCYQQWGGWIRVAWPRLTPILPGSQDLRVWLERLLYWARHRGYVYVDCPTPAGMSKEALFASVGLAAHGDIYWRPLPRVGARWTALGRILKRRKKPFDIIVAEDEASVHRLQRWAWWHQAIVVRDTDDNALERAWSHRSRYPL